MTITKQINQCTVRLEIGDITDFEVEAFVFYATEDLKLGAGFGNAITMRGGLAVQKALDEMDGAKVEDVLVTEAGMMKAKHIIHAVGPKFQEENIETKLANTVRNVLTTASDKGFKQIAFPAMGAGFYGIPLPNCAKIMLDNISSYLAKNSHFEEIIIRVLDKREYTPFVSEFEQLH